MAGNLKTDSATELQRNENPVAFCRRQLVLLIVIF
jgi:hypothetical protein